MRRADWDRAGLVSPRLYSQQWARSWRGIFYREWACRLWVSRSRGLTVLRWLGLESIGWLEKKSASLECKRTKRLTLVKSHMVARSRAPTQSPYVGITPSLVVESIASISCAKAQRVALTRDTLHAITLGSALSWLLQEWLGIRRHDPPLARGFP